jgi:cytochrome c-type biogenesis protein CcmH
MVFWISATVIALVIAGWTMMRMLSVRPRPLWPTAMMFAVAAIASLGAAVQGTVASMETLDRPSQRPVDTVTVASNHGDGAEAPADSFEALITQLEARLKDNPKDAEGWGLLGRSYVAMGRMNDAATAFASAVELTDPPDADLIGEYGETLVAAADGRVVPAAEAAFKQILAIQPDDPRALFYMALAYLEKGDRPGAIEALKALLASAPPKAPWADTVFERIQELEGRSGTAAPTPTPTPAATTSRATGAASAPGPTQEQMQAAQEMTPEDRMAMIQGMVDSLAGKLEEDPDNYQGWLRLANAYMVLDRRADAAGALANALKLQPANVGLLIQYAEIEIAANDGQVTPDAKKAFDRVIVREPKNPQALWRLGQAAAARGDKDTARQNWQAIMPRLLEADPLKAEVRAALKAL